MPQYKIKKIWVPPGPTVVWKKDRFGKVKPTIVRRRGYYKITKVGA